jgi:glycosyltransferase involved in cell wall biosynthesis
MEHGVGEFAAFVLQRLLGRRIAPLFRGRAERRIAAWRAAQAPAAAEHDGQLVERRIAAWRAAQAGLRRPYVIWSTLDWHYPYRQRPQHIAKALASLGHPVIYVTPSTGHDRVLTAQDAGGNIMLTPSVDAALAVLDAPTLVILSTDTRWHAAHLDRVAAKGGVVVYDYLDALDDSLSVSAITPERRALHARLLRDEAGTAVISVADVLDEEVARARSRHHAVVTNGVDLEPFLSARRAKEGLRADFAAIVARGRPIIGYYGVLAAWFDYELMIKLARARPDYEVVTIGPDLDGSSVAFAGRPANLHVLPGMNYEYLPRHGCWFDVCLVPFVINHITLATSPLKIFEYMAMRAPIVSVAMPECRKYASCLIGEDHDDFIAKVDAALALRGDAAYAARAAEEARQNAWTTKVAAIDALVDGLLAARAARP